MKKILIVSYTFYPEISPRAFRTLELAKELAKNNDVTILTKINEEIKDMKFKNNLKIKQINSGFLFNKNIKNKKNDSLEKIRANKKYSFLRKIYRYLFAESEMEFAVPIFKELKKDEETYDAIISIARPFSDHLGVYLSKIFNPKISKIIILDYGDPFYKSITNKRGYHFKIIERLVLKKANYVTIPILEAQRAYEIFKIDKKIKVIPQGFNLKELNNPKKVEIKNRNFMYAGAFYEEIRNPLFLFEKLNSLKENFIFNIYTSIDRLKNSQFGKKILEEIEKSNGKIILKDVISREKIIEKMKEMEFLINLENINTEQSPSKLIDYAISGRPILSFNQENFDIEIFKEFLDGNYKNKKTVELEKYDIKNVAKQFQELIEGE